MAIPYTVQASVWVPLTVLVLLVLMFSMAYVFWYRSAVVGQRSGLATSGCIAALFVTLLTCALVPVDVFVVSVMKFRNGTYKPWADSAEARLEIQSVVLWAYYILDALVLAFAFFVLPMIFFYVGRLRCGRSEDLGDEEEESFGTRMWRAIKFTSLFALVFLGLVALGFFLPLGNISPPDNSTHHDYYYWVEQSVGKSGGLVVFILNVLNLLGMILLVVYTGYGMSSLPATLIKAQRRVFSDLRTVEAELEQVGVQIHDIEQRYEGRETAMPRFEVSHLDRLKQRVRLLARAQRDLEQEGRGFWNRVGLCCRPFQVIFGVLFALLGLLMSVSLFMESLDRALHSQGPKHGYIVANGSTIPNPADTLLVYAQALFPLDFFLYCSAIVYLVFCSMSGVKHLGIRFCCLAVYKIRSRRTKPEALALMCLTLIFLLLALNVLMFSILPDYTTYGSQYYITEVTVNNVTKTVTERCGDYGHGPALHPGSTSREITHCDVSGIASLLLSFHSSAWIFAAIYYWLCWAFLVCTALGALVTLYRSCLKMDPASNAAEDDEEQLLDDRNPFSGASAPPAELTS